MVPPLHVRLEGVQVDNVPKSHLPGVPARAESLPSEAIHRADQGIVDELKLLSELKKSFMRKELDHTAPHVVVMLSEIQEQ